ncbi:DNA helicase, partial [Tanacetum coccineum]
MKDKQQNSLIDKGSSLCPKRETKGKHRIRSWRKIYADAIGTHYLNGDSVSSSNCIPLECSHLGTRQYELPTAETIGAIVFAQSSDTKNDFNKLHPCYMSLQFPLLFIYGEDGYHKDMKLANVPGQSSKADKRMSMNMYYSYQMHDRLNHYSLLLRGGKLFQQYIVTAYCAIEQNRLDYIRQKQHDIRNEYLSGIYDAIVRGDRDGSDLGLRTVLTTSFTGGPRYMYAHYLDALAICRVHGSPSFFITFTCNAKWPEIEEFMEPFPHLTTADRADIVDHVFEKKVRDYIHFVRELDTFGDVTADSSKVQQDIDVDRYVSAELPDPITDADGYAVVSELMIHGPCGPVNMNASCMKDGGKCNREFPKAYYDRTYIDKDGFVHYRRRDTGIETQRQNVWLDNRYVVPYNRTLWTDRVIANVTKPVADIPSTSTTPRDLFYERMLLCHQKGCKSFAEIRMINGIIYPINKAACHVLGLLGGDEEWIGAFQEAALSATALELRKLFVHILIFCNVADPLNLWQRL